MLKQKTSTIAVKFCGFTEPQALKHAIDLGVDAIGLVFYDESPRAVNIQQAKELVKIVPAFTTVVALVVNISEQKLINIAQQVIFDVIQFHGNETARVCQSLAKKVNKRWIKALRISQTDSVDSLLSKIVELKEAGASGVLLDAYHPDKFGGTGEQFNWAIIPQNSPLPIILAGGLTSENVTKAVSLPIAGVDVSGGIELVKGEKDLKKMQAFMQAIRN